MTLDKVLHGLTNENHAIAVEIATLPEHIRGYAHIKMKSIEEARSREGDLLTAFKSPAPHASAAE